MSDFLPFVGRIRGNIPDTCTTLAAAATVSGLPRHG